MNFIQDKTIVYEPHKHVELVAEKIIEKILNKR